MGDSIFAFTLILWIATVLTHQASWAPLAVSGGMLAEALPMLIVGPLAGVFVDRWNKRRTMLWMDFLRMLLVCSLLFVTGAVSLPFWRPEPFSLITQLWLVYGIIFLASSCSQFFTPARLALTGEIVSEPLRTSAASMEQITQSLALIFGPVLAAPLLFGVGIGGALLINALSFGLSWLAIALIRGTTKSQSLSPGGRGQIGREFVEGLRFSLQHRVIRSLIIGLSIAMFGIGAYNTLYVLFFLQNLHASVPLVGLLDGVFGAGVIIGAILAGISAQRVGMERLLSVAGMLGGASIALLARMNNSIAASAVLLLIGACQGALGVTLGPLMLKVTPHELIGRVVSILNPLTVLASLLATPLVGYLAGSVLHSWHTTLFNLTFGPLDTILLVAGLTILLAGIYLFKSLQPSSHASPETITAETVLAQSTLPLASEESV
jgi:MFS family permease